ncbi:MAG: flagellar hook-basal body complex protein FliE [Bryobacterales bacterium]|nr:flagellar hook-basal body complex protein FliE [Bryobacterales bacterium]
MIDPIKPIGPAPSVDSIQLSPAAKKASNPFSDMFQNAVDRVELSQQQSEEKTNRLLRGEDQDLHEVILAGQRADLEFQYFLQTRNKVVQAYQEIMRMQL